MSAHICRCGGGRAHHENDLACWCPNCLKLDTPERCVDFAPHVPITLPQPPKRQPSATPSESPKPQAHAPVTTPDDSASTVLSHIAGTGSHGVTPGEIATFLHLGRQATTSTLKKLAAEGEITLRESPRTVGSEREDVWIASCPSDGTLPQQTTLWA